MMGAAGADLAGVTAMAVTASSDAACVPMAFVSVSTSSGIATGAGTVTGSGAGADTVTEEAFSKAAVAAEVATANIAANRGCRTAKAEAASRTQSPANIGILERRLGPTMAGAVCVAVRSPCIRFFVREAGHELNGEF